MRHPNTNPPCRTAAPLVAAILSIAFCLAVAGCGKKPASGSDTGAPGTGTAAPVKIRFLTDWYPQAEHGGFYQALVKGYFTQAGLDVEILPGGSHDTSTRRVSTGDVQFGMATEDDLLIACEHGLPLLAVGATMQHDPQAIMVRADSPVKTFADLEGHTVSVDPATNWFAYMIKKYNLHEVRQVPLTYNVANFVHDPNYIQQVFVTSEPYFVRKQGIEPRLLPVSSTGFDRYRVFFGNKNFIAKNPEATHRFVAACVRGWTEYLQDPSAANAEILKRNPEMTPDLAAYSWQALKDGHYIEGFADRGEAVGQFKPERWRELDRILREVGVLTKPNDPQSVFTTEFLSPVK